MELSIEQLLVERGRTAYAAEPEMDALTEEDALQETQLLSVRFDALTSSAWFLFDCRQAIQLREPNTAVLVVNGVTRLEWSGKSQERHTAWNVVGSTPTTHAGTFSLVMSFFPDARLRIEGRSAEFLVGEVLGLGEAPPNFVSDSEETIAAGLADWKSTFRPTHATHLDVKAPANSA